MTTDHTAIVQRSVLDLFRDIELLEANLARCSRGTRRACALPLRQLKDELAELHNRSTALLSAHPESVRALLTTIGRAGAETRLSCRFSDSALGNILDRIGQIRDIRNAVMAARTNTNAAGVPAPQLPTANIPRPLRQPLNAGEPFEE